MLAFLTLKYPHQQSSSFRARAFLLALLALPVPLFATAEDTKVSQRKIAVVTHRDNTNSEITRAELGRMFMKKTTLWRNGQRCIPIDQTGTSEIRSRFYRTVLDRSVDSMKRYWMRETMTGNAKPPVSLNNSATAKKYVQKIKGGVAYIYEDEVDESIKVLHVKDIPDFSSPEEAEGDGGDNEGKDEDEEDSSSGEKT